MFHEKKVINTKNDEIKKNQIKNQKINQKIKIK